ncbi:hypothetical protein ANO11243_062230 [Dothideomycetidae sp. 11243]|nr:hypothetical protein ANO11243_062230 [fungal sp. No.11243]
MATLRWSWTAIIGILIFAAAFGPVHSLEDIGPIRKLPLPSQDPFYASPLHLHTVRPGTVLRTRKIRASYFGFVPHGVVSWQILYRSNDVKGAPIAAVTTIFQPSQPKRDRFVSYQTAYNSACANCVPSFTWRQGSGGPSLDHLESTIEFLRIQGYLLQGYVVSSPDHEGPDSAFGVGRVGGKVVLDSMRAVTDFGKTQGLFTSTPAIVGVGYSGGGIPTSWASALQRNYAPELPIKGWVFGGAPVDWTETIHTMHNSSVSGLVLQGISGLLSSTAYNVQLEPLWGKIETPAGSEMLRFIRSHCLETNVLKYRYNSILTDKFQSMGASLLHSPTMQRILTDNLLGLRKDETPMAPVLLYHGKWDQMVPLGQVSSLAKLWCSRKADVTFTTYYGEHMTCSMLGIPKTYRFVNKAFAGTVRPTCSKEEDTSNALDSVGLSAKMKPLLTDLAKYLDPARRWDRGHLRR